NKGSADPIYSARSVKMWSRGDCRWKRWPTSDGGATAGESGTGLCQLVEVLGDPGVQRHHLVGRRWRGRARCPRRRLSSHDGELADEVIGEAGDRRGRASQVGRGDFLRAFGQPIGPCLICGVLSGSGEALLVTGFRGDVLAL